MPFTSGDGSATRRTRTSGLTRSTACSSVLRAQVDRSRCSPSATRRIRSRSSGVMRIWRNSVLGISRRGISHENVRPTRCCTLSYNVLHCITVAPNPSRETSPNVPTSLVSDPGIQRTCRQAGAHVRPGASRSASRADAPEAEKRCDPDTRGLGPRAGASGGRRKVRRRGQLSLRPPRLADLIASEMERFKRTAPEYADLRRDWHALRAHRHAEPIEALAHLVGKKLGVSAAVTEPLIAVALSQPGFEPVSIADRPRHPSRQPSR